LYSNWGYGLLKARRCKEALDAFEVAQRLNPGHGYELVGMGECLLANGETDRALKVLQRALKRNLRDVSAMIAMARAQIANDEAAKALGMIKRFRAEATARTKQDSATAHYLAAQAYKQLEKYPQARQSYGKAVELVQGGQQIDQLQDPSQIFQEYAELLDLD